MRQQTTRRVWLSAAQALLGSAGVALLTYVCYRLGLDLATTALLDLIAIVLFSLTGTFGSAAVVALAATLCLNYLLVRPLYGFWPDAPFDFVAVVAFLITSLVISRLLSKARHSVREAQGARDQLRLAVDTIPALVWTTRPDGSSEFSNQRWLEYAGLSREQAGDWGYTSAIHPEDYERLLPRWTASFASGEAIEDEARMRRADGEYRWFLHRAVPLRDEHGKIVKWYGTSADIEDRKQAEEVLRKQTRLLDLTHDTVFVRDMNDIITYWNRGAEELYGWASEEAVGKVSHQLTQTVFPAPLEEIMATLHRTGHWEGELVHAKRDGSRVTVASRWSLQRDELGNPVAVLETNNDVTAARQAQEELRRSEAYLAEAQRLSHTGSWASNLQRPGEGYWSAEMHRIFGLDPTNGPPALEEGRAPYVHPEDWPKVQQAHEAAIRDKTDFEVHFRGVRPDGSIRYVYAVGRPVVNAAGEAVELLGTVMDLTDRRRAERALRRAREGALKVRFDAVLDERTRLAREIHDTLLQGFTGVALQLVAVTNRLTGSPETAAALRDLIALAQKTLGDARRAVWDLRTPSPGGDFPAALRTVAEDQLRDTELAFDYQVEGSPQPIEPDVEAVALRVVQEAITNIVKHAKAGTVRVRLSFEECRMRVSVLDNGGGFIVDPNFHAYGGHWGLLGMRERATQVHGKLSVRSAPGKGTEILLLVPYSTHRTLRLHSAATP